MDVVEMYDYYFLTDVHRKFDDVCEFGICEDNVVYRRMRCAVAEWRRTAEHTGHHANHLSGDCASRVPTDGGRRSRRGGEIESGLNDVLEYMLYNVSGETGLPAHYSCCMYLYKKNVCLNDATEHVESGHVCNAIPIMIGSKLERRIVERLAEMVGVRVCDLFDADYLHRVYSGAFLVNGTFYYSVFRESNNNKICHNSKSKYRGDETVAYFYDKTCNRGVKLFTDHIGRLRINDRDGNELAEVTSDVMLQLYEECVQNSRHYTLDMELIKGFFSSVKELGLAGIDDFKNKIYTNYSIGLNTFLDKLPASAMRNPMWNSSLMVGKINFGISQRLNYPKSKSEAKKLNEQKLKMCSGEMSTGYLVETQRRRNTRKAKAPKVEIRQVATDVVSRKRKHVPVADQRTDERKIARRLLREDITAATRHTILGSKDVKTSGFLEKLEQGERNGPSTFNQVSVSYLPLIRVLSNTVQKLQVEHVHAESSKTVPRDAYGFVCMKYMGNISTAGKNMLFTDRVQVAYGHVHRIIDAIERGLESLVQKCRGNVTVAPLVVLEEDLCTGPTAVSADKEWTYLVINNAVTSWRVQRRRLVAFLVFLKTKCHPYAWIKLVGSYLCVYYYEGVPLLRYEHGEMIFHVLDGHMDDDNADESVRDVRCMYFSRDELDMLASLESTAISSTDRNERTNTTNRLIDYWFMRRREDGGLDSMDHSSLLAKHLDQYTNYTAPAKRSVSVNARKSACTNVYYQRAAELIRGFSIFVDPDAYERTTAEQVEKEHGLPEWVTVRDFARMRADVDNCPQLHEGGDVTDLSLANFYMLRTVFADVAGYNVEDANVMDASVDLKLSFSYSFSLTFVDRTESGLDIIVPPSENAASVCCWDAEGNPTTVLFMVCTIRKKSYGGDDRSDEDVEEMLRTSLDVRMVTGNDRNGGSDYGSSCRRQQSVAERDSLAFPPFRKLSVLRSEDGNYHVYFMRSDAVLMRALRRVRGGNTTVRPDMSNATRLTNGGDDYVFLCKPEVNPRDALTHMHTRITTFEVNSGERVVTIDTRVRGTTDKYDGVKVVNSFGQKGLALIKDLRPYFGHCTLTSHNVPVQLVMNNCSFVSRQPIGQYLQMRKNMFAVAKSAVGEETSVGYTAVFLTESEPVTKSCLVRFDEMMRSVIITLGLTSFQNLKSSLDNVYNPRGLLYPPQMRQILSLYRCYGVAYSFSGDIAAPFATRDEVRLLLDIYDVYSRTPKPTKATDRDDHSGALLDILDALCDQEKARRLVEMGVLSSKSNGDGSRVVDDGESGRQGEMCVLRLYGQWVKGIGGVSRRLRETPRGIPDYVLRTYDSTARAYKTVLVYGEPRFISDALDERYVRFVRLEDHLMEATAIGDDENLFA